MAPSIIINYHLYLTLSSQSGVKTHLLSAITLPVNGHQLTLTFPLVNVTPLHRSHFDAISDL